MKMTYVWINRYKLSVWPCIVIPRGQAGTIKW